MVGFAMGCYDRTARAQGRGSGGGRRDEPSQPASRSGREGAAAAATGTGRTDRSSREGVVAAGGCEDSPSSPSTAPLLAGEHERKEGAWRPSTARTTATTASVGTCGDGTGGVVRDLAGLEEVLEGVEGSCGGAREDEDTMCGGTAAADGRNARRRRRATRTPSIHRRRHRPHARERPQMTRAPVRWRRLRPRPREAMPGGGGAAFLQDSRCTPARNPVRRPAPKYSLQPAPLAGIHGAGLPLACGDEADVVLDDGEGEVPGVIRVATGDEAVEVCQLEPVPLAEAALGIAGVERADGDEPRRVGVRVEDADVARDAGHATPSSLTILSKHATVEELELGGVKQAGHGHQQRSHQDEACHRRSCGLALRRDPTFPAAHPCAAPAFGHRPAVWSYAPALALEEESEASTAAVESAKGKERWFRGGKWRGGGEHVTEEAEREARVGWGGGAAGEGVEEGVEPEEGEVRVVGEEASGGEEGLDGEEQQERGGGGGEEARVGHEEHKEQARGLHGVLKLGYLAGKLTGVAGVQLQSHAKHAHNLERREYI
ncbi:LOW QUALITY PROTEIN: hypothetical protein SETIT_6G030800v2 [Setaria italica]|uniref:Uncharacterized protein n=1 Tax=Setaria italica TaxID=4555 RepID=A0A368RHQ7_SETIT|nr:LOW QUALITY PROTEIN: hypothetical protein SETIT_6G030800v2 [Setaria italica]